MDGMPLFLSSHKDLIVETPPAYYRLLVLSIGIPCATPRLSEGLVLD